VDAGNYNLHRDKSSGLFDTGRRGLISAERYAHSTFSGAYVKHPPAKGVLSTATAAFFQSLKSEDVTQVTVNLSTCKKKKISLTFIITAKMHSHTKQRRKF
jgi:hypothetical protein